MAAGAGGGINHPKSVYGKKKQLKQRLQSKVKSVKKTKLKKKGARKNVDALTTTHILKKTRTNPSANITLSGKKKRLLLKQLKREEMEKQKMDVVIDKKADTQSKSKKIKKNHDVEKMDMS